MRESSSGWAMAEEDAEGAAEAEAAAAAIRWSYVATQGPLRHTRDALWQLVAEQASPGAALPAEVLCTA